ncbi:MAG: hypothetical protein K2Y27_07485 [Xanthobacteraceae bacterium]|nr:hypothetical protein [Xanthobacteraceae bacterium]
MAVKLHFFASIRSLPAAMVVAAVTTVTGVSAQTPHPTPPAAATPSAPQQQPSPPAAGGTGMPMQHMDHGRQMQGAGQPMMERGKGGMGEHSGMGAGAMGAPPCPPAGQPASGGAANCK